MTALAESVDRISGGAVETAARPGTVELRSAVLVSADTGLRRRLAARLTELRWQVREARGGAEAVMHLDAQGCEAMLIDNWLPDLEVGEFEAHARLMYPAMDLLRLDGTGEGTGQELAGPRGAETGRSPRRNELLHAIRTARENSGPEGLKGGAWGVRSGGAYWAGDGLDASDSLPAKAGRAARLRAASDGRGDGMPEMVGGSAALQEVVRLVELVAPRSTRVLIEGETGTGKEVVARALHRLSRRAAKPFAVLNCAAIPETLLEAELFGHARGAFTGAVHSRMGRIEAASGGTLLLDEIGEMPVGMQAKMLRFLESGELQKVGETKAIRVDVRLIAATHQPLEQRSAEGTFRLDLYHRMAVFPIEIPPLRERAEDIAELAEYFLERMGRDNPRKRLCADALARLQEHSWPGNVRELMHVLERGAILAGVNPEITAAEIRYRRAVRA